MHMKDYIRPALPKWWLHWWLWKCIPGYGAYSYGFREDQWIRGPAVRTEVRRYYDTWSGITYSFNVFGQWCSYADCGKCWRKCGSFVEMMNEEAMRLGATNTSFANPHGLSDDNHFTTAYDLYLIFNEAIKYDSFNEIIHMTSYQTTFYDKDGKAKSLRWIIPTVFERWLQCTGKYYRHRR